MAKKEYSIEEIDEIFKNLHEPDEQMINVVKPFLDGLYRYYFRCNVTGWANVPESQAIFVGNHNGVITWEVLMLFYGWFKKYGLKKRAIGLAHDIAVSNPLFSWLLPKLGAVPANPDVAVAALSKGYNVLVFPGGLKEAYRPSSEREKVDFYQRKGFIKLALRAEAPIVPVLSIGAHETYFIMSRGEELAKALGLKDRYRLDGVPLTPQTLFLMWCMATGALTFFPLLLAPLALTSVFIPMPAKMDFQILKPIDVCSMMKSKKSEKENLQDIYDHILNTMQAASTRAYRKRKYPVIG